MKRPAEAVSVAASTSPGFARAAESGRLVILVPVGSVEPHGPHLALGTDSAISEAAAGVAAERLRRDGWDARLAPTIPYGVTDCASGFAGAISIPKATLTAYLSAVVTGFVDEGAAHVCLINNHLEPDHDAAVRAAIVDAPAGRASVACPLTRRWARTLSAEFKSGACHAGQYETSIVMAHAPEWVDESVRTALPEVPVSLSDGLRAGLQTFAAMGLDQAYAGAPASASAREGRDLIGRLADMVVTEVVEAIPRVC